jgi:hypothetical protein
MMSIKKKLSFIPCFIAILFFGRYCIRSGMPFFASEPTCGIRRYDLIDMPGIADKYRMLR